MEQVSRRRFLASSIALASSIGGLRSDADLPPPQDRGIRVRFLGSGAAGWRKEWLKKSEFSRRHSSVLLEGRVLIDFTHSAFDKLPHECRPQVLFQTHSHGDHYNASAAVKAGVKRMYVQESWASAARSEVAAAAERLSMPAPEVIALPFGKYVEECGMRFMGVPANHSTSRVTDGVLERTSLYLVEKGPSRLLYATDTGGLPGDAARMIGIDPHISARLAKDGQDFLSPYVHVPKAITALIMEATNGNIDDDFRIFSHSSVNTVARIVKMLRRHGRYDPPAGQAAYLTHLAIRYRDWPPEKIDSELPPFLRSAYDGLELVLG